MMSVREHSRRYPSASVKEDGTVVHHQVPVMLERETVTRTGIAKEVLFVEPTIVTIPRLDIQHSE